MWTDRLSGKSFKYSDSSILQNYISFCSFCHHAPCIIWLSHLIFFKIRIRKSSLKVRATGDHGSTDEHLVSSWLDSASAAGAGAPHCGRTGHGSWHRVIQSQVWSLSILLQEVKNVVVTDYKLIWYMKSRYSKNIIDCVKKIEFDLLKIK